MPLVRIALMKNSDKQLGKKIGKIIYESMMEVFGVPEKDNFQIISEHNSDTLIYDPEYLGIKRDDGMVIIQITLNSGRSVDLKKAFYKTVAEQLNASLSISLENVFINLVEVDKENWSFGNGIAQYAE